MRRVRRSLAVLAAIYVVGPEIGCAVHHQIPTASPVSVSDSAGVPLEHLVLEIENHNWSDVVVFVLHDGHPSRLAQVTAGRSVSVPLLPSHIGAMGTLRLTVHPIGGSSDYTSESLSLRTGNTVRLTVESRVAHSSVAVW